MIAVQCLKHTQIIWMLHPHPWPGKFPIFCIIPWNMPTIEPNRKRKKNLYNFTRGSDIASTLAQNLFSIERQHAFHEKLTHFHYNWPGVAVHIYGQNPPPPKLKDIKIAFSRFLSWNIGILIFCTQTHTSCSWHLNLKIGSLLCLVMLAGFEYSCLQFFFFQISVD
jgi:hypothetical protein